MKRILFSPIGSTDPISGCHDGALLHIIRVYRPEEVYLYMSKEICELEKQDQRYTYCLEKMKQHLNLDFAVKMIKRPEFTDVHIFDFFLNEFRSLLQSIYEDDCEMLLNVSSGTPAMKSALHVLSCFLDKNLIPIQVATPAKRINDRENVRDNYDNELQWEYNLDNEDTFEDRTSVSAVVNLVREIKFRLIRQQIEDYDYVAALRIAEGMGNDISEKALDLMRAGAARLHLDRSSCTKICNKYSFSLYPEMAGDKIMIYEYLLILKIKIKNEEYSDFLRAISPLFFVLLENVIQFHGGIHLDDFIFTEKNKETAANDIYITKWKIKAVSENEVLSGIIPNNGYNPIVTTEHYCKWIAEMDAISSDVKALVDKIRSVEKGIRNPVAHTITCVTEDIIKKSTGMNAKDIYLNLRNLTGKVGVRITSNELYSYDNLNNVIIDLLPGEKE